MRLCELFGFERAVFFGHGRAGLTAVLQALGMADKPLLFGSNVCPAVLAAAVAARCRPVSVEVSPLTGLPTPSAFLQAMKSEPCPGVVMPAHLYGFWESYQELRDKGWFVLENDTLCAARAKGLQRRAIGDALLVSFNQTKTIEAGIGGVILTNDLGLARSLQAIAGSWPEVSESDDRVEYELILVRRHLRSLGRGALGEQLLDLDVARVKRKLPAQACLAISEALDRYEVVIAEKWARVDIWERALSPLSGHLLSPDAELAIPWRLTRRLGQPELRDPLLAALRSAGFDAGSNYPPLARDFPNMLPRQRDAERWGDAVLNLWLTSDYDKERIESAFKVIEKFFDKSAQTGLITSAAGLVDDHRGVSS